jgi:hypothetical protein
MPNLSNSQFVATACIKFSLHLAALWRFYGVFILKTTCTKTLLNFGQTITIGLHNCRLIARNAGFHH